MLIETYKLYAKFKTNITNAINWRWGRFIMKVYGVSFGKNLIMQGVLDVQIGKNASIAIGDSCTFKSGRGLNPLSRNIKGSISVEDNALLVIGNNCGFSSVCLWSHLSIKIGNYVNVGADTIIMDSDAHSLSYLDRRNNESDANNKVNKPIIIDDDVLIGTRCIILKGVHIGARSIIGSGSVVVNDIPEDCVAAGNPAKIIRKINFN
jgi:acetyltransferase-like isoleucine patch superfamily enzyme